MSKKKAHAISNGIFLISLGVLIFTNTWWPGMLIALWATLASRQYLTGRVYQAVITSIVLIGLFVVSLVKFDYDIIAPVILVVGGIFLIIREYYFEGDTNGEEASEKIIEDTDIDESE